MATILQTPSINTITSFDPQYDATVSFVYNDNQIIKNRAIIIDNEANVVVYDATELTMRLQHTIPAGKLVAGKQYLIQIQVFDSDGNSSNLSESVLFYCFTTPTFYFSNINNGDVYKTANITLDLVYEQPEGEVLKNFQFLQYSSDKIPTNSSSVLYSSSSLHYTFHGLINNSVYYFRAIGETSHGMILDTGYISISIAFDTIPANLAFSAENNYKYGYIDLRLNIINIGYEIENDNYTLQDGLLTLINNSLSYNKGFNVDEDFSLFVEAKQLPVRKFLTTNDNEFTLSIVKIFNEYYCQLNVKNSAFVKYIELPNASLTSSDDESAITTVYDDVIQVINEEYESDTLIVFEVKRINGYYSLNVYYREEE